MGRAGQDRSGTGQEQELDRTGLDRTGHGLDRTGQERDRTGQEEDGRTRMKGGGW